MLQDEEQDGDVDDRGDGDHQVVCPFCQKKFKHKKSLVKHLDYRCKSLPAIDILTAERRVPPVPPTRLKVDPELDDLLSTVDSNYVRWRLAQVMGVCQQSSFPVLFNYRFPGSKTSRVPALCPTSNPYSVLCNILLDARENYQVEEIAMSKGMVIVNSDGTEFEVRRHLKPLNNGATD